MENFGYIFWGKIKKMQKEEKKKDENDIATLRFIDREREG